MNLHLDLYTNTNTNTNTNIIMNEKETKTFWFFLMSQFYNIYGTDYQYLIDTRRRSPERHR